MAKYRDTLIVNPGTHVKLAEIDPAWHGEQSKETAEIEIAKNLHRMDDLQLLMFAEHQHSLLIILQGLDASGKDGVVRHVLTGMNPAGCIMTSFKAPSHQELGHDFLWRIHLHAPAKGNVAIFNRSHYEDVLVVRVHNLVPKKVWSQRYDLINEFERCLAEQNNTTILKFFLYISKEEQLERLIKRLDDPKKHWKVNETDFQEREHWGDYIEAYEDVLCKTSTDWAPWFVIPANHKWFRNLAIAQIIIQTMEGLRLPSPAPTADIEKIRRLYLTEKKQSQQAKGVG